MECVGGEHKKSEIFTFNTEDLFSSINIQSDTHLCSGLGLRSFFFWVAALHRVFNGLIGFSSE